MEIKPVLIVESSIEAQKNLVELLAANGHKAVVCSHLKQAEDLIVKQKPSIMLLSINHNIEAEILFLSKLQQKQVELQVIILSGKDSLDKVAALLQAGALDYIVKPFKSQEILVLVNKHIAKLLSKFNLPIIESKPMKLIMKLANKVAKSNIKVLITGKPGTGKSTLARYIHDSSAVNTGPLLEVNCAYLTRDMLNKVLFGCYTKQQGYLPGKIQQANEGTLLLENISALPFELQQKLLKVFQEKVIDVVNGDKIIPLRARIIATTSKDLKEEVKKHNFDEMLYYRLSVFPIEMPALINRKADVELLIDRILELAAQKFNCGAYELSKDARNYIFTKDWAGNITELEHYLNLAVELATGKTIGLQDLTAIEFNKITLTNNMKPADKVTPINR